MALTSRGVRFALWGAVGVVLVAAAVTWRQLQLRQNPPSRAVAPTVPGDTTRTSADGTASGPFEGNPAPTFSARNVYTSKDFNLSDFKGQPVLLNFWATWCGPCKQEMPDLQTFSKENPDLKIIAVGADPGENPIKLANYAKALGLTFTIASDEGAAASKYRVVGIPSSFFIDRQGVIRARHQGILSLDEMRDSYKQIAENANK